MSQTTPDHAGEPGTDLPGRREVAMTAARDALARAGLIGGQHTFERVVEGDLSYVLNAVVPAVLDALDAHHPSPAGPGGPVNAGALRRAIWSTLDDYSSTLRIEQTNRTLSAVLTALHAPTPTVDTVGSVLTRGQVTGAWEHAHWVTLPNPDDPGSTWTLPLNENDRLVQTLTLLGIPVTDAPTWMQRSPGEEEPFTGGPAGDANLRDLDPADNRPMGLPVEPATLTAGHPQCPQCLHLPSVPSDGYVPEFEDDDPPAPTN